MTAQNGGTIGKREQRSGRSHESGVASDSQAMTTREGRSGVWTVSEA